MPKFKVFDSRKPEPTVFFKLDESNDHIVLRAYNNDGVDYAYGTVLIITPAGELRLAENGKGVPGLQYDAKGRIKMEKK